MPESPITVHEMPQPGESLPARNLQLDALRGIAALSVMLFHFTSWYGKAPVDGILALRNFVDTPHIHFYFGDLGVPLFFMISGYVITKSCESRKTISSFAYSRFARLYPLYWCSLIFAVICYLPSNARLASYEPEWLTIAINFSMLQTAIGASNVNEAYWTLYIELQFYSLVALALATQRSKQIPVQVLGLTSAYAVATAFRCWDWIPGIWRIKSMFPLVIFLNYFALGIWVRSLQRTTARKTKELTGICLSCAFLFVRPPYNALAVLVIFFVFWAACEQKLKILENRLLVLLGTISYALYLIHGPCGYTMLNYFQEHLQIDLLITAAVLTSILAAALLTYTIEKPMHNLLLRQTGRRKTTQAH